MLNGIKQWFLSWADPQPVEDSPPPLATEAHAVAFNAPPGAERAITRLRNLYLTKHPAQDTAAEITRYQHLVGSFGYKIPQSPEGCSKLLDSLKG